MYGSRGFARSLNYEFVSMYFNREYVSSSFIIKVFTGPFIIEMKEGIFLTNAYPVLLTMEVSPGLFPKKFI